MQVLFVMLSLQQGCLLVLPAAVFLLMVLREYAEGLSYLRSFVALRANSVVEDGRAYAI